MTAIVFRQTSEPRFEGQTKTKLDNQMQPKQLERSWEELVLYFDKNLDTLKKSAGMCRKISEDPKRRKSKNEYAGKTEVVN